ncbi:MAG: hypothetical protein JNM34_04885 [Chthonomonadaceae bacterium]|nr:hypothetical protein [Chthonomonadaceae bacterium]
MQWLDTGWFGMLFVITMVAFILYNIHRAEKRGKDLFIRRIPGLNAIDDAIGRATEMGRPVLMVPGIGDLNAISVQAINIYAHVTKAAAQFGTPIRLCVANAAVYTVAQEVIRDVYQEQGVPEKFDTDSVRFLTDRQFAFAATVSGLIFRERVAAAFFLGEFFAESLIFAESANSIGAIQVAGSTEKSQTPFFIAACDYVLIGDEFYAASAYLTRQPLLVGSLVGQDWCKLLITASISIGFLWLSVDRTRMVNEHRAPLEAASPEVWAALTDDQKGDAESAEGWAKTDKPELIKKSDTFVHRLFNPMYNEKQLIVERQKKPAPAGEGQ